MGTEVTPPLGECSGSMLWVCAGQQWSTRCYQMEKGLDPTPWAPSGLQKFRPAADVNKIH